MQEICTYVAAADGAHTFGARHTRSKDEVNTRPQRTEKQVSKLFGGIVTQTPNAKARHPHLFFLPFLPRVFDLSD